MQCARSIVGALCLLSSCFAAKGQDPYYTVINKVSGLPSSSIYELFQDKRGFIWIAGNEGLTRYDGFEFKTYYNPKQTSTAGNETKEDKFGRIWYKNFDGYLYYVKDDSLHALKQNATIGNSSYAILNDRLLVLQKDGIDIYDLASLRIIKTVPFDHTQTLSQLQYKDHFYIASSEALYKVSGSGDIDKTPLKGLSEMMAGKKAIMVISKNNATGYWDEIKGNTLLHKIKTPDVDLVQRGDYCGGYYWLFTPSGGWAYKEDGTALNNGRPFFPQLSISTVLKDRDNNFWFGTINDGIIVVPDMNTRLITNAGFEPGKMLAIDSLLYVSTKNNEIYTYSPSSRKLEKKYEGNVRHEVLSLAADSTSNHLFIAAETFTIRDPQLKVLKEYKESVKDIVQVGAKYLAIAASGAIELVKVSGAGVSPWDSLYEACPYHGTANSCHIMEAGRGRAITYNPLSTTIYAGSNKGLHAISPRGFRELRFEGEPIYPRSLVYYNDAVYVLTPQSSLYRIDRNNDIRQLKQQGERLNCVRNAGGILYLLMKSGIQILDTVSGKILPLSMHPNIRNEEIYDIEQVGDALVLSSDRGLIVVNKLAASGKITPPGFTINEIYLDGRKIGETLPRELTHEQNDIDIRYSILSFNRDAQYRLFYKINNGSYKRVSNSVRVLRLASLAPGTYDLSFKLQDEKGNDFGVYEMKFVIKKPFWSEWWFWGLCAALFSVGAYTYYKWKTTQLKKQSALRLEKVELEKNLRNSMLTSIRAQMNPHFFYNALNTIQSFIFSDDKRNASTYLVKLSKLTRMVLEMSEKDTIPLEEESEALKLYLELEKMRFDEDFHYELSFEYDVDPDIVRIPPMIVQPYVENAIKHGLLHKKGDKKLSVRFVRQEKTLCITIDDNGVGRKKAGEIAGAKRGKHHSFATSANDKRIELLNKGRQQDIGVVYIDKTNDGGSPHGTTVIISIPLN